MNENLGEGARDLQRLHAPSDHEVGRRVLGHVQRRRRLRHRELKHAYLNIKWLHIFFFDFIVSRF